MARKNKTHNKRDNDKNKRDNDNETLLDRPENRKYKSELEHVHNLIYSSMMSKSASESQYFRKLAIEQLKTLIDKTPITDYLLIDCKPEFTSKDFLESCFNLGTLIKNWVEVDLEMTNQNFTDKHTELFIEAIGYLLKIIHIKNEDKQSSDQITSVYTKLCYYNRNNLEKCIKYLHDALLIDTCNPIIHYNLGFIYAKLNKLELSLIHYKLSNKLILNDNTESCKKMYINNYNGLCFIYRSIKQWPQALYYLKLAEQLCPDDPDVQNQLGVVYTEMRRTDLAEKSYMKAITNYEKTFVSNDPKMLLSEIYLNFGHMFSYNGDNNKSIECYNKALTINPTFSLPFQNKIMNLSYVFDQLEDKMYILNQHKLVNKLYKHGNGKYVFTSDFFNVDKINIGIISGDFVEHPVSYFISTLLKKYDPDLFNLTCYSECLLNTGIFNKNITFKFIKNMSQDVVSDLIYDDKIHILFDLAGHTAFNRLDVFAMKPSPIQITYIGYPYSTGLNEMDYRITDNICDDPIVSQPFYTEKLLFTKGCFLCYNSNDVPELSEQPFLKNGWITIGCFNRLNKINDKLINGLNKLMLQNNNIRLVFKTKALLNSNIRKTFLDKFDRSIINRILIKDCNITHVEHLKEYNNVDIAVDTMPYSGTTTSCEALLMGVPVYTFYDSETYFHPQNVTASILKNSHASFSEYIINDDEKSFDELDKKIKLLQNYDNSFWKNLKPTIRNKFLTGDVCNGKKWINDFQEMLTTLYKEYKQKLN